MTHEEIHRFIAEHYPSLVAKPLGNGKSYWVSGKTSSRVLRVTDLPSGGARLKRAVTARASGERGDFLFSGSEDDLRQIIDEEIALYHRLDGESSDDGWSDDELDAAVAAYAQLAEAERQGRPINKRHLYRTLEKAHGRAWKAFEFRMQNISAILAAHHVRWVSGLAPRTHVGTRSTQRIESLLREYGLLPMSDLPFAATISDLRRSLESFNEAARDHLHRATALCRQTIYWVYDPVTDNFGPSKFVAFKDMTFDRYEAATQRERKASAFDGGRTRESISSLTETDYVTSAELTLALRAWGERLLGTGVLDSVDSEKWLFLELPDDPAQRASAAAAIEAMEGLEGAGRGQGFRQSPMVRKAIENHAMDVAKSHFEDDGYAWKDTSANRPYDLVVTRGAETLYVEIKGTSTAGERVILTRNEVRHARRHPDQSLLFIVAQIEVDEVDGEAISTGGVVRKISPWVPADEHLLPISYEYTVELDD